MRCDEHPAVEDLQEALVPEDDVHGLARKKGAHRTGVGDEADPTVPAHHAGDGPPRRRVRLPVRGRHRPSSTASGARRGELLALRWADVDLEGGSLKITRTLSATKEHGLFFKEPKSLTSKRKVSLPSFAVVALIAHHAEQSAYRLRLGGAYHDQDLVLPLPESDGRPWAPNLLTGAFRDFVRKQGLPPCRFHDLGHGHITQLLLDGVPLKVVSARAGHSGIQITADVYGHVVGVADEQAAAKCDLAVGSALEKVRQKASV